jgi:hypothetical protein
MRLFRDQYRPRPEEERREVVEEEEEVLLLETVTKIHLTLNHSCRLYKIISGMGKYRARGNSQL